MLAVFPAGATTKHTLDGKRTRTTHYTGSLDGPTLPVNSTAAAQPATPDIRDCIPQSCDIRELSLTLPRNTTSGRFHATVVLDVGLEAALVLYDAKGVALAQTDGFESTTQNDDLTYQLDIHVERLSRGQYTLALVDRAGMGNFAATVAWVAHPPRRPV